jgi:(1->4)-alpha-D-glucan 1-alpha-D-glucosylmutase
MPERAEPDSLADVRRRVQRFMRKSVREARVRSSWVRPDVEYEKATNAFVERLLDDAGANAFLASFLPFQQRIARIANVNSLSQKLLALTAPGVPDLYQGTEIMHYRLVDPDNRMPVDFTRLASALPDMKKDWAAGPASGGRVPVPVDDPHAKLFLVWRALAVRAHYRAAFLGEYLPLETLGRHADRVVAFARMDGDDVVIVAAPVRVATLMQETDPFPAGAAWEDTVVVLPESIPEGALFDNFTSRPIHASRRPDGLRILPASDLFGRFPAALLTPQDGAP